MSIRLLAAADRDHGKLTKMLWAMSTREYGPVLHVDGEFLLHDLS